MSRVKIVRTAEKLDGQPQVPMDLYFLMRRAGDKIVPRELLRDEIPTKYGSDFKIADLCNHVARLIHGTNPEHYDSSTNRFLEHEKDLMLQSADRYGYQIDLDTPLSDEEKEKVGKFRQYMDQKHFFEGSRAGERGAIGSPQPIDSRDLERIQNMPSHDDGVNYFTDLGKHLYAEHGWCLGDFQRHPTEEDRRIAHDIEMNPLLGSVQAGGTTGFEAHAMKKLGYQIARIPVLGSVTPSWVSGHAEVMHGRPMTMEEHHKAHMDGVVNHSHINL
jgi:hypothetical protein